VWGHFNHGNEHSCSIKYRELFTRLRAISISRKTLHHEASKNATVRGVEHEGVFIDREVEGKDSSLF
jgi:hypothetical protein